MIKKKDAESGRNTAKQVIDRVAKRWSDEVNKEKKNPDELARRVIDTQMGKEDGE